MKIVSCVLITINYLEYIIFNSIMKEPLFLELKKLRLREI